VAQSAAQAVDLPPPGAGNPHSSSRQVRPRHCLRTPTPRESCVDAGSKPQYTLPANYSISDIYAPPRGAHLLPAQRVGTW